MLRNGHDSANPSPSGGVCRGIDRLGALPLSSEEELSSSSSRLCRFWTVAWADVEALCLDWGIDVVSFLAQAVNLSVQSLLKWTLAARLVRSRC
jgi:hypothetical protein